MLELNKVDAPTQILYKINSIDERPAKTSKPKIITQISPNRRPRHVPLARFAPDQSRVALVTSLVKLKLK